MTTEYVLKQATTKSETDAIMDVIWAANHVPYEPFIQLFFPVLGVQPSDRQAALAASKDRIWAAHERESTSNWLYVQHSETGQVVGCAQWQIFPENPFPPGSPKLEAPWWPVKAYRDFCENIIDQVYKPRRSWMTRPHLALNWMAVVPDHRRLGIASRIMEWGVTKADELRVEAWMESSPMAKPLYEKFGFQSLFKIALDTGKPQPDDQWLRMEHEMTPTPFNAMWRPVGGDWEESKMPWELGVQKVD